jgi:hypothetical protein
MTLGMPLILAIEPDRRQAAQISVVVRKRVRAELILVDTTERALDAIGNRIPDLVLVPALLSPQDDAALAAALRVIAAAAHVQMLTIPVLGSPQPAPGQGVFSALRRGKPRAAEPDGCDPAVFAEQIASYLERAAEERPAVETTLPAPETPADPPAPPADAAVETIAAVDEAAGTVEEALTREWIELLPVDLDGAVEPAAAASPDLDGAIEPADAVSQDESVTFAIEEAVRALFAAPTPAPFDPATSAAEIEASTAPLPVVPDATKADDWRAVDDLISAFEAAPLAPIEVDEEDDWIALDEPTPAVEESEPDEAVNDAANRSKELRTAGGKSEPEWVALISSLRHDVKRLRVERTEEPKGAAVAAPRAARIERKTKPVPDEWGLFDPEQCGFAALLAKLDEVTDSEDNRMND